MLGPCDFLYFRIFPENSIGNVSKKNIICTQKRLENLRRFRKDLESFRKSLKVPDNSRRFQKKFEGS
jgi:hypothetical protein